MRSVRTIALAGRALRSRSGSAVTHLVAPAPVGSSVALGPSPAASADWAAPWSGPANARHASGAAETSSCKCKKCSSDLLVFHPYSLLSTTVRCGVISPFALTCCCRDEPLLGLDSPNGLRKEEETTDPLLPKYRIIQAFNACPRHAGEAAGPLA